MQAQGLETAIEATRMNLVSRTRRGSADWTESHELRSTSRMGPTTRNGGISEAAKTGATATRGTRLGPWWTGRGPTIAAGRRDDFHRRPRQQRHGRGWPGVQNINTRIILPARVQINEAHLQNKTKPQQPISRRISTRGRTDARWRKTTSDATKI